MTKYIIDFFNKHQLDLRNKRVVIAVSTGIDSMALLYAFLMLKDEYSIDIHVAHLNHLKRDQSFEEATFLENYCLENDIKYHIEKLKTKDYQNFHDYARNERYDFFNRILDEVNGDYLILAHHSIDNMETILMRIIRGSNLKGYSGIDELVNFNNKLLLRPFLNVLKGDLIEFVKMHKIKYYQDASNEEDIYTRNRVRKLLIPEFFKEDENVHLKFQDYANTLRGANLIVEEKVKEFVGELSGRITFKKDLFLELSEFLQIEVIFYILKKYHLSKANVLEIIKLIKSDKSNIKVVYKEMFTFAKEYEIISFFDFVIEELKLDVIIDRIGSYQINDTIAINVIIKNANINTNNNDLWYNSNMLPIRIRSRKDGDKILLDYGYKKVKDLLIDEKIGIIAREKTLIVEKDNEILAVLGVRKSSLLKQIKQTDIIVKVEYKNG